jgi:hypothetical protein
MRGLWILFLTHAVPVALLWAGHSYRSRSVRARRVFWGALLGYVASIVVVVTVLLTPPVFWGPDGGARWLVIQWAPMTLAAAGAATARWLPGERG